MTLLLVLLWLAGSVILAYAAFGLCEKTDQLEERVHNLGILAHRLLIRVENLEKKPTQDWGITD